MSAKDVYFFPHDFHPDADPKINAMLGDYGGAGYGLYWFIVEQLHAEPDHKLPLKEYIYLSFSKKMQANAKQMLANAKQKKANAQQNSTVLTKTCFCISVAPTEIELFISDCINRYELFKKDDSFFWSERVRRNIDKRLEISKVRAASGRAGAKARKANAKQKKANA